MVDLTRQAEKTTETSKRGAPTRSKRLSKQPTEMTEGAIVPPTAGDPRRPSRTTTLQACGKAPHQTATTRKANETTSAEHRGTTKGVRRSTNSFRRARAQGCSRLPCRNRSTAHRVTSQQIACWVARGRWGSNANMLRGYFLPGVTFEHWLESVQVWPQIGQNWRGNPNNARAVNVRGILERLRSLCPKAARASYFSFVPGRLPNISSPPQPPSLGVWLQKIETDRVL